MVRLIITEIAAVAILFYAVVLFIREKLEK